MESGSCRTFFQPLTRSYPPSDNHLIESRNFIGTVLQVGIHGDHHISLTDSKSFIQCSRLSIISLKADALRCNRFPCAMFQSPPRKSPYCHHPPGSLHRINRLASITRSIQAVSSGSDSSSFKSGTITDRSMLIITWFFRFFHWFCFRRMKANMNPKILSMTTVFRILLSGPAGISSAHILKSFLCMSDLFPEHSLLQIISSDPGNDLKNRDQ